MVRVESAWLAALVAAGVAPTAGARGPRALSARRTSSELAGAAETGGNPVIPLLGLLREQRRPTPETARPGSTAG